MDCVKVHAAKYGQSYSYKGWGLTKSSALSRSRGVLIAFECGSKRKFNCIYKLIVRGEPEAVTAKYTEFGYHNHDKPKRAELMRWDFKLRLLEIIQNEHTAQEALKLVNKVKRDLGLLGDDVPPFQALMESLKRKRRRNQRNASQHSAEAAQGTVSIPQRNFQLDGGLRMKYNITVAKDALVRLAEIEDRRRKLVERMKLISVQEKDLNSLKKVLVVNEEADEDIQVLTVILKKNEKMKTDLLKLARPRRPFPEIEQCNICFDAYTNIVYYGCGKICACEGCATDMQGRFITCLCCNKDGTVDEDGKVVFQIVT